LNLDQWSSDPLDDGILERNHVLQVSKLLRTTAAELSTLPLQGCVAALGLLLEWYNKGELPGAQLLCFELLDLTTLPPSLVGMIST
jgi:hypothetical protein